MAYKTYIRNPSTQKRWEGPRIPIPPSAVAPRPAGNSRPVMIAAQTPKTETAKIQLPKPASVSMRSGGGTAASQPVKSTKPRAIPAAPHINATRNPTKISKLQAKLPQTAVNVSTAHVVPPPIRIRNLDTRIYPDSGKQRQKIQQQQDAAAVQREILLSAARQAAYGLDNPNEHAKRHEYVKKIAELYNRQLQNPTILHDKQAINLAIKDAINPPAWWENALKPIENQLKKAKDQINKENLAALMIPTMVHGIVSESGEAGADEALRRLALYMPDMFRGGAFSLAGLHLPASDTISQNWDKNITEALAKAMTNTLDTLGATGTGTGSEGLRDTETKGRKMDYLLKSALPNYQKYNAVRYILGKNLVSTLGDLIPRNIGPINLNVPNIQKIFENRITKNTPAEARIFADELRNLGLNQPVVSPITRDVPRIEKITVPESEKRFAVELPPAEGTDIKKSDKNPLINDDLKALSMLKGFLTPKQNEAVSAAMSKQTSAMYQDALDADKKYQSIKKAYDKQKNEMDSIQHKIAEMDMVMKDLLQTTITKEDAEYLDELREKGKKLQADYANLEKARAIASDDTARTYDDNIKKIQEEYDKNNKEIEAGKKAITSKEYISNSLREAIRDQSNKIAQWNSIYKAQLPYFARIEKQYEDAKKNRDATREKAYWGLIDAAKMAVYGSTKPAQAVDQYAKTYWSELTSDPERDKKSASNRIDANNETIELIQNYLEQSKTEAKNQTWYANEINRLADPTFSVGIENDPFADLKQKFEEKYGLPTEKNPERTIEGMRGIIMNPKNTPEIYANEEILKYLPLSPEDPDEPNGYIVNKANKYNPHVMKTGDSTIDRAQIISDLWNNISHLNISDKYQMYKDADALIAAYNARVAAAQENTGTPAPRGARGQVKQYEKIIADLNKKIDDDRKIEQNVVRTHTQNLENAKKQLRESLMKKADKPTQKMSIDELTEKLKSLPLGSADKGISRNFEESSKKLEDLMSAIGIKGGLGLIAGTAMLLGPSIANMANEASYQPQFSPNRIKFNILENSTLNQNIRDKLTKLKEKDMDFENNLRTDELRDMVTAYLAYRPDKPRFEMQKTTNYVPIGGTELADIVEEKLDDEKTEPLISNNENDEFEFTSHKKSIIDNLASFDEILGNSQGNDIRKITNRVRNIIPITDQSMNPTQINNRIKNLFGGKK